MGRIRKSEPTRFKPYETRNPNGLETGYMRITESLHNSDAIKDLTNLEYRIFMNMKHTAKGHDEVAYTQQMAIDATGCCKDTYTSTMITLEKVGLVEKKPRSAFGGSVFRFSSKWHDYASPCRDALTGKYIKKKTKLKFPPKEQATM